MPSLHEPLLVGERPQRVEAPRVDLDLLLGANGAWARLHRQRRLAGAAADAHLHSVAGDRQVTLLDRVAVAEALRRAEKDELALDLDAGGHGATSRSLPCGDALRGLRLDGLQVAARAALE